MACPMGYGVKFNDDSDNEAQTGLNKASFSDHISYSEYLQLNKLLSSQKLRSGVADQIVPDEHLFIIIHQAYELWFKQIIFDIDHVRNLLDTKIVDETKTLQIVSLLERTVRILKLLVDQMLILETMSPLDFVEFRKYLASASGFQSLQFRLLENKLGMSPEHRVRYNSQHYREAFISTEERLRIVASETEPSLFVLIEKWLARTPGIYDYDEDLDIPIKKIDTLYITASIDNKIDSLPKEINKTIVRSFSETANYDNLNNSILNIASDNNILNKNENLVPRLLSTNDDESSQTAIKRKTFWNRYLEAVNKYLQDMMLLSTDKNLPEIERKQIFEEYLKTKKSFDTITDNKQYQETLDRRERRLSHNALKGALMIYFYRDMPRFSQPYQILTFLMDIDSLLQKWRYNHVMLVQRMLGSKQGTGGSSGYLYLRTTVSDRYKVFLDLFNLSTWLIPRVYIPKLSPKMVKTLSEHSNLNHYSNLI